MSFYKIVGIAKFEFEIVMHLILGGPEDYNAFGRFPSRDLAISFYRSQLADQPYEEEIFDPFTATRKVVKKYFKKDSPMEWLDPLTEEQLNVKPCSLNFGIQEIVVNVEQVLEKEYLHD